ncbi:hypothetical protein [Streptomyces sulphureus]|nr:hypothetical protein [Streptomyces sulphureus]
MRLVDGGGLMIRAIRRLGELSWRCWICGCEVDDALTRCPIQH